jgi:putative ABC transport system permease protein
MSYEKYKHLLDLTVKNIFRRRLRSVLTILAVVIGIATIVSLFLISDGLFNYVEDVFLTMGINTVFIFPISFQGGPTQSIGRITEDIKITQTDLKIIEKIGEIDYAVGFSFRTGKLEYKNQEVFQFVTMLDPKLADKTFEIMDVDLREGKSLQGRDASEVILGSYLADNLFKDPIKVGQKIKIQDKEFKVIGILESVGNLADDSIAYITLGKGKEIFEIGDTIDQIYASVKEEYDPLIVQEEIEKRLEKEHGKDKFYIITAKQVLSIIQSVLGLLKIILVSIGLISVVVGSIGIMNSIYTSVIERTKEIGILKSLGAKREDIYFIFTIEAVILSLFGGIIGLGLGIFIAKAVQFYASSQGFLTLKIVIGWPIIVGALVLSIVIGIVSGLLPSKQASKMNVVEALRNNF